MPTLGEVVEGKYRIEAVLGQGAMGCVYRAAHLTLGHHVAIKFLRAAAGDESLRARFVREAKATMMLRSEHVVRVFDLGFLPSTMPYMVLEYLDGIDLRSLLDRGEALSTQEAVDYALQVCEALAEAHLNGIVHRDLKPQNLFRVQRPNGTYCIKLLDFGVSKVQEIASSEHELTASQILLGSPAFMPPEQIRSSAHVDARADIWSLGVVLYMLLGGGRPFDGAGLPSLCAAIMVDAPRPLAARCPGVPPELEAVIFRCLEKSRERRYASVGEVASALEPFASTAGLGSAARVRQMCTRLPPAIDVFVDMLSATTPADGEPSMLTQTASVPDPPAWRSSPPPHRSLRTPLKIAALGLLLAGAALLYGSSAHRDATSAAPSVLIAPAAVSDSPPAPSPPLAESPEQVPEQAPAAESVPVTAPPRARSRGSVPRPNRPPASKTSTLRDRNGVPIVD